MCINEYPFMYTVDKETVFQTLYVLGTEAFKTMVELSKLLGAYIQGSPRNNRIKERIKLHFCSIQEKCKGSRHSSLIQWTQIIQLNIKRGKIPSSTKNKIYYTMLYSYDNRWKLLTTQHSTKIARKHAQSMKRHFLRSANHIIIDHYIKICDGPFEVIKAGINSSR